MWRNVVAKSLELLVMMLSVAHKNPNYFIVLSSVLLAVDLQKVLMQKNSEQRRLTPECLCSPYDLVKGSV
jgi:hypothetical protein